MCRSLNLNYLFPSLSPLRRGGVSDASRYIFGRHLLSELKLVQGAERGVDRVVNVVHDLEAALDLLRVAGDESKLGFYRLEGFGFSGRHLLCSAFGMSLLPDK
jgi:hypothetical protein